MIFAKGFLVSSARFVSLSSASQGEEVDNDDDMNEESGSDNDGDDNEDDEVISLSDEEVVGGEVPAEDSFDEPIFEDPARTLHYSEESLIEMGMDKSKVEETVEHGEKKEVDLGGEPTELIQVLDSPKKEPVSDVEPVQDADSTLPPAGNAEVVENKANAVDSTVSPSKAEVMEKKANAVDSRVSPSKAEVPEKKREGKGRALSPSKQQQSKQAVFDAPDSPDTQARNKKMAELSRQLATLKAQQAIKRLCSRKYNHKLRD